jgi:hypothetical protein
MSRRMFSLLTPVLLAVGSFCTVIHVLHEYNLCNLLGSAIPRLQVAIAAGLETFWVLFLGAFKMARSREAWRLSVMHLDVIKTLANVALYKSVDVKTSLKLFQYRSRQS